VDAKADAVLPTRRPLALVLALRRRIWPRNIGLPLMVRRGPEVEMGGLMSYYADALDYYRRAPRFVDKISKARSQRTFRSEQPPSFEFVINLKTRRLSPHDPTIVACCGHQLSNEVAAGTGPWIFPHHRDTTGLIHSS